MQRPCKNFPPIEHHAKLGCCFSYSVCACRRSQNFGGTLGPHSPNFGDVGRGRPLRNTLTRVTLLNVLSRSNCMGVCRGIPKIWGAAGPSPLRRVCLIPRETLLPVCYFAKFGRCRSNDICVITEMVQKCLTL